MDKLTSTRANLPELEQRYHFARRIFAERTAMNHAAVNIVSTTQERIEQYGHPAYRGAIDVLDLKRFAVIPPGVNLSIFDHQVHLPGEEKTGEKIRQMFQRDLAPDRQSLSAIVSSSRLDSKKNTTGLVKAFATNRPLQELANLVIFVRGIDNPLRDHSKSQFEEKDVLDEIVHLANTYQLWGKICAFPIAGQKELAAAYRYLSHQFSVFSLTALYEPFGLAPLEAIAAGLPGVVTKNGGPSESLYDADTNQEFGVLINPVDPDDIAKGLLKILSDRKTWEYYQKAGIQRVYDRYTWEQTATSYLHVIRNMIEKPESSKPDELLQIPKFYRQPDLKNDFRIESLLELLQNK